MRPEPKQKVYVVMTGMYSSTWFGGVFSTPEKAMAAFPVTKEVTVPPDASVGRVERPGGWQQIAPGEWTNGLDWSAFASIEEVEIDGDS